MTEHEDQIHLSLSLHPERDAHLYAYFQTIPVKKRPQVLQGMLEEYVMAEDSLYHQQEGKNHLLPSMMQLLRKKIDEIEAQLAKEVYHTKTSPTATISHGGLEKEQTEKIDERLDRLIDLF